MLEGLSARNQLRGTVVAIRGGGVLSEVVVRLGDGQEITSVITRRSVEALGLRRGLDVVAVIKSTEVMLFR
ncbi:MAG TPA: TOBE domain-containing protein [Vicinamibacteria bacterium]|nr:TOBE domain-containing protein [Vicinamibacteria bacterium]